jgi:anti-sigma factor RsiW
MTDAERLSRLLSGDLDPTEARALRARLAAEPALAEEYRALQALVGDLASLPQQSAPQELDAAVLAPRTRRRWWPLALAAAALLAVVTWPRPAPSVVRVGDALQVDGAVTLAFDGVTVAVDGRASIATEPGTGVVRGRGQEDVMHPSHLVSALAGAALVVAVQEGTATVRADGAAPVAIPAGQQHTIPSRTAPPLAPARVVAPVTESPPPSTAELQARIAHLEQALAASEAVAAISRGQLALAQGGDPVPWPTSTAEALQPEAFRASLDAFAAEQEGLEVVTVDCDEYPCVALVRLDDADAELRDVLQPHLDQLVDSMGGGAVSVSASNHAWDDQEVQLVGFAIAEPDQMGPGSELGKRIQYRSELLTDEVTAQLADP